LIDRLVNYGVSENLSEIREEIAQGHASRCLIHTARSELSGLQPDMSRSES